MSFQTIRRRLLVVAAAMASLVSSFAILPAGNVVEAGSGLNRWKWGDAGYTLSSSSSYRYSNMSGLWQAVVNSNGCNVGVDGDYGNVTTWWTAVFQNGVIGGNNGGVMTPSMLNAFHGATSVYGSRLVYTGYTDGYGTQHDGYYGGLTSSDNARLGWNPFGSQWLCSQHPWSNPNSLVPATVSRTIGDVAPCS